MTGAWRAGAATAAALVWLAAAPAGAEPLSVAAPIAQSMQQAAAQTEAEQAHPVRWRRRAGHSHAQNERERHTSEETRKAPEHGGGDLKELRNSLEEKLRQLNSQSSPEQALKAIKERPQEAPVVPDSSPPTPALAAVTPPKPACAPVFEMSLWRGDGPFWQRLQQLRRQRATSHDSPTSIAAQSEFYLADGFGAEALGIIEEAKPTEGQPADQRLALDADLARLVQGRAISADSPLLNNPATCDRPDLPLWRALAAAAAHDPAGAARDTEAVIATLRSMPEPLVHRLAFRIADAVADDSKTLKAVAELLRKSPGELPQDKAAQLWMLARIAGAESKPVEQRDFLKQAAAYQRTIPGLRAQARLAEMASTTDGPDSAASEPVLADIARVYRDDVLGQSAAAYLAERKLRHFDYPAALQIADQSARSDRAPRMDSRGAAQVGRILRILLVDPAGHQMPPAADRVALFLRYQGYATPGQKGDDIRLGAAKLLLAQGLPGTALDVAHELSEPMASTPEALATRAIAEARSGDPNQALTLLRQVPASDETHRAASEALARLARPVEAARALDGLTAIADRLHRADLLLAGQAWADAAAAYADVLRDPALTDAARRQAFDSYSMTVALAGIQPDPKLSAPGQGLATRVLASLPPAQAVATDTARNAVTAARGAVQRAKAIESLLPSGMPNQGS